MQRVKVIEIKSKGEHWNNNENNILGKIGNFIGTIKPDGWCKTGELEFDEYFNYIVTWDGRTKSVKTLYSHHEDGIFRFQIL